ncbi:ABC transporter permease [Adhaeribacter sp. BT258]|uniref:ABC transporter permease n=1 Tax=Adhaeribacter terrigena TaxID=2793070 RepID=A0ABS1C184_9BACT|nr:ABC transporter permease [Adhaeribacter terrigena]MBK0403168.1 ABC transporter permease [Adhaeribacter terrigena]
MLKNYFKTAYRNLLRHKFYSAITILGLATGIACFLLIFMFIQDEVRYDKFHSKADRIYRMVGKLDSEEGQGEESSSNPPPVAQALKTDYPHLIEETVRFFNFQQPTLTLELEEKKINEKHLFFADSTLFKVFDFPLAKGNPEKALAEPNSIVLTQKLAEKYFGDEDPLGKVLKFEGQFNLKVTGVLAEIEHPTHIPFEGLISFRTAYVMSPNLDKNWVWNPAWTYILLKDGVSPEELEAQFPNFIKKYYPEFVQPQITHYLQPLKSIHLHSDLDYEMQPNGDINNIFIFGVIGIFILVIACINFMNLATARAAGRAKEVGIRKVSGAYRSQLIGQFLAEAVLLSFLAVMLALALVEILLPVFSEVSGKALDANIFTNPALLVGLLLIGLLTGLVSGLYPAFFLSAFEPVKVLKGSAAKAGSGSAVLRKSLVVLQFAISLGLIVGTFVINRQLQYMRSVDLGFKKEQVLILPLRPPLAPKTQALTDELLRNKNITSVTTMNEILGENHNTHEFNYEGMERGKWIYFPALIINEDFVKTLGLQLVAGRDFSKTHQRDDSLGLLINEAMVKHLGWGTPENAIGKRFDTPGGSEKVIGVVKDFNFVSVANNIGPFVLDLPHRRHSFFWKKYLALRISPENHEQTMAHVEQVWGKFSPQFPLEYFFLDQRLNQQYRTQENLGKLVGYFSILAIMIACLGLFALASFTAQQRTKEIGIRKVMGASVRSIVYLLTKDFVKLVMLAALIAFPVAYFGMHHWLRNFAYRVPIPVWVFVLAGFLGLLIAVLTVSYQAIKAAYTNPVKSLKWE